VGIALGSAAVAILAGFLFFLFRRRGCRGTQKSHVSSDENHPKDGLAELATATKTSQERGGSVHELEQEEKPVIPELGRLVGCRRSLPVLLEQGVGMNSACKRYISRSWRATTVLGTNYLDINRKLCALAQTNRDYLSRDMNL
jgi:hypothetical protein